MATHVAPHSFPFWSVMVLISIFARLVGCYIPNYLINTDLANSSDSIQIHISDNADGFGETASLYWFRQPDGIVLDQPRNLIAFTVMMSPTQLEMISMFLDSIFQSTPYLNFSTAVSIDQNSFETMPLEVMSKLMALRTTFIRLPNPSSRNEMATMKYAFMYYLNISQFERVLYLDTDILLLQDVMIIFNLPIVKGLIYAPPEGWFNRALWTANRMHHTQWQVLASHGIRTFNSGTVLFIPDPLVLRHFREVIRIMRNNAVPNPTKMDQRYLNDYFNQREKSRTHIFKKKVCFKLVGGCNITRSYLVHFCGVGDGELKVKKMQMFKRNRLINLPLLRYNSYESMLSSLVLPRMRVLMLGAIAFDAAITLLSLRLSHFTIVDLNSPDCLLSDYNVARVLKFCPSSATAKQLESLVEQYPDTTIKLVPYKQMATWVEGQSNEFFDVFFLYGANPASLLTKGLLATLRPGGWIVTRLKMPCVRKHFIVPPPPPETVDEGLLLLHNNLTHAIACAADNFVTLRYVKMFGDRNQVTSIIVNATRW